MKKFLCLVPLLLISTAASATDDSVQALVGTQTYQCTIGAELDCRAVNEVQQKQIVLKKNGSSFKVSDVPRGLEALIETSVSEGDMNYDVTFCSKKVCTLSSSNGGSDGYINQTMFGQYNITEKTFFVLGFFISTQGKTANFKKILTEKLSNFHKSF